MLPTTIHNININSFFSSSTCIKARRYYREGRVGHVIIKKPSDHTYTIEAIVSGSQDYRTKMNIQVNSNGVYINTLCSCPMQRSCKHVVAALLRALDDDFHAKEIPPVTQKAERDIRVERWLTALTQSLIEPEVPIAEVVDKTYSLYYLLSAPVYLSNTLIVKLCLARRLVKTGVLGTPRKFSTTASSHQKYLYSSDKKLLIKLEVVNKYSHGHSYSDYTLKGEAGEELLSELLSTKRCYWINTETTSALTLGPTKEVQFNWEMNTNGNQKLFCYENEKLLDTFLLHRSWYVDRKSGEIGLINSRLNERTFQLLLSAPEIPPAHTQEVSEILSTYKKMNHIQKPHVIDTHIKNITPIPHLSLVRDNVSLPGSYKTNWLPVKDSCALAKLSFDYEGIEITWKNDERIIKKIENNTFIQFKRDQEYEKSVVEQLLNYKLIPIHTLYDLDRLNPKLSNYFLIGHNESDPLEFSVDVLPILRGLGWRIDIADDYPYIVEEADIEGWYSSIDEDSGYDWFGLELGIILKGENINLLPVLQKLLQRIQKSEPEILNKEFINTKLPDGRYVRLPGVRLRSIFNILLELYDKESLTAEDRLRLSRLDAARLLEIQKACGETALRWLGGEKLRKLGERLVQCKEIKPVDCPQEFKGELRPYQRDGLSWMQFLREYELGGILADDMGLGKTVQALCHIALEKASGRMQAPILIVAPTSLMFNWRMEAKRFCPHLKVLTLHGSQRKDYFEHMSEHDVVLTTYPLLLRDKDNLLRQSFYLFILDEAQCIKNKNALVTQVALQIKATYRLCLTGTPMENHLGELWSLFNFVLPGLLGKEKQFNHLFKIPIEKHEDQERQHHLNKRIAPFLLRRTKDCVVKELPEKIEMIHQVELADNQRDLYETIRVTMHKKIKQEIKKMGLARSHIIILDALLKLRQVCCDPRLLKIATPKNNKKTESAKLDYLMTLVPELLAEGRRILLFSQFTEMLGLIEAELNLRELAYVKLTGQTQDRSMVVKKFQDKEVPLFLISLKAGGTGLNLTAADVVIHYDPWWNPAVENQATDRAHRIGQDKTIFVYKLITKGTVEEKIIEMQKNKHALVQSLFSEQNAGRFSLTDESLQALFEPLYNGGIKNSALLQK